MEGNSYKIEALSNFIITFTFVYLLSIISLFTTGLGADDPGYIMYWENTLPIYDYLFNDNVSLGKRAIEPFYSYLFSFFKLFTNDFEVFKFFNTFITLGVLSYSYYLITKKYYLYFLIYTVVYLYIDFNIDQFRNALAASFGLLSIVYLNNGLTKKSLLFFLVSVMIHNSMLWLILLYFSNIKLLRSTTIVLLLTLVFIPNKAIFLNDLLNDSNLSNLALGIHFVNKLTSYTYNSLQDSNTVIFALVILKSLFIYLLGIKYKINRVYLDVYLYAILLYYVFIDFNTLGGRILRDALLLEPVMLFYIIRQNISWVLIVPFIFIFNIFSKNLCHIERILM